MTAFMQFLILLSIGLSTTAWDTNKQYKYEVRGRVITGLHQVADQFSGVLIRASLIVQPKSPDRLSMKVESANYAPFHSVLSSGWSSFISDNELKYRRMPFGNNSFELDTNNGVVKGLNTAEDLPNWELNFLKAIASQFQLDTQASNLKKSSLNDVPSRNHPSGVFKVMEDTISGVVETIYDIAPIPPFVLQTQPHLAPAHNGTDVIEVIKTKNFTNNLYLPSYHFGFTEETGWEPASNEMGDFLSRSSVSRAVISGSIERFVVQSSVTVDKIVIAPHLYNKQRGIVASTMNVTLESVGPTGRILSLSNGSVVHGLSYEYFKPNRSSRKTRQSWSYESFSLNKGYKSSRNEISEGMTNETLNTREFEKPSLSMAPILPFAPFEFIQSESEIDWTEEIKQICAWIGENMYRANWFMKKRTYFNFNALTEIIRTLSSEKIKQSTDKIYFSYGNASHDSTTDGLQYQTWVVLRDAVAEAGTGPALLAINDWISSGMIKGEEAAEIVAALPRTARYPTPEYMETLFELATNDAVASQSFLNTTAILSLARLLRKVQNYKNFNRMYPVHTYGSLKPEYFEALKQKFISYMAERLDKAISEGDSSKAQVYMFALGRLGDPKIIPVIEPYLQGRSQISDFLRLSMVIAVESRHRNFTKLFEEMYKNDGELPEVRVAAVLKLMNSNPSTALLQRMAEFTNYEHNKQVNSVVKSAIESVASMASMEPLVDSAKAATPLLAPHEYGLQYSKHYRRAYDVRGQHLKYDAQLSYIESEDSIMPSSIFYILKKCMGGYRPQKFEVKGMSSSFKQLNKLIAEKFISHDWNSLPTNDTNSSHWSFEKINEMLNLTIDPPRKVEGNMRVNWMGGDRLFTFDNETINRLIPEWAKYAGSYFRERRNFNFTKYHNQMSLRVGFPTAAGFPFWYSFDVPTVAYLGGQVQGKVHPDPNMGNTGDTIPQPVTFNSTSDIIMTYSSRSEGQMGFMTPFDDIVYAARLENNFLVHVPARITLDLDGENSDYNIGFEPLKTDKYIRLFEYSTKAYTCQGKATNMTRGDYGNVTVIQVRPPKRFELSFGKDSTGFSFDVKAETQKEFPDWAAVYKALARHDALSLLFYPFEEASISNNNFTVWFNPHQSTSERGKLTVAFREALNASQIHGGLGKPPKFNWLKSESSQRQNYFLWSVLNGVQDGYAHMTDISLEFIGHKATSYAATVALAKSPVSPKTGMALFVGRKANRSPNAQQHYQILLQGSVKMPKVPLMNYKKALSANPTSELEAEIQFGDKPEESKITLRGKMSRSDSRVLYIQNRTIASQCVNEMSSGNKIQPACRNITSRALFLDRYDIKANFKQIPESLGSSLIKLYNMARPYLYWYNTEETLVNSKNNELRLKLVYGKSLHSLNVSLDSPKIQAQFNNIPINPFVRPILGVHPEYDVTHRLGQKLMKSQQFPVCVMDKSMATTFDNRSYPINLGQCWHVMVHKVSDSSRDFKNFSIILRETGPDQKEVIFILGQDVMELKNNQVKLNGRNLNVSREMVSNVYDVEGQLTARIYPHISESIRVETVPHRIEMMYDGTSVKLMISNQFRGQLRGLCGTFDGEKINDFTTPRNCIVKQPIQFTASSALPDSTCQSSAKEFHRESQSAPCFKRLFLHGPLEAEEARPRSVNANELHSSLFDSGSAASCIDHRIKIIENEGKTCFSLLPQVTCKSHCRKSSQVAKMVEFHCINDSNVARRWVQMVKKGANPEFNQGGPNHKAYLAFPERCYVPAQ